MLTSSISLLSLLSLFVILLVLVILICAISGFILLECKIRIANHHYSEKVDAVVILGAKVRNSGPSLSLISRMDAAILAAKHSPNAKLVLSGGRGSDEPMSEAQAMYDYLTLQGIDKQRLVLEDKSSNTIENLTYSMAKMPQSNRWLIITNDYHAYRACMFADALNINAICHGAPAPSHVALKLRIREYIAILYYWLLG